MMQFSITYFCGMKTDSVQSYFKNFFIENDINLADDKYLLAVSGGIDSMVLFDLFLKNNINFSVASCNFQLRGKDSDNDLKFVENICIKNNINFYSTVLEVDKFSTMRKISTQMAARELRYNFFKKTLEKYKYSYIATAHHLDDNIETIIFNFIKSTGYKGLVGIPFNKNKILRPLINVSKDEIEDYAVSNNITWRLDKSNNSNKYSRNKIRNEIIPLLKEINPSLGKSLTESLKRIKKLSYDIKLRIDHFIQKFVDFKDDHIHIKKHFINNIEKYEILLFDFFQDYGFNYSQIENIIKSLKAKNQKKFISSNYQLIIERESIFLISKDFLRKTKYESKEIENIVLPFFNLSVKKYDKSLYVLNKSNNNAQLDFKKIKYPICIRNYKKGEKFLPLGMKKNKKISDFLSDKKVNYITKLRQCVITDSTDSVLWVIGHQISDKFKVDSETKNILEFEII
tara:strand:+ start:1598 stop:2968 length:1371 start_codon:yes stop_codon:yes gene_type:complete